jgi:EAL domain-containing protein (putative c-di-GMP-specific phosphodiesterase class I)
VHTIINLARLFKLAVVAEGVEDQPTLEVLARMNCDCAQGYLFAPALDAERLRDWLITNGGRA